MQKLIIFALLIGLSACTNRPADQSPPVSQTQELLAQGDGNFGVVTYGSSPIKSLVFTNNTNSSITGNPVINGSGFDLALQLNCALIEPGKSCLVKILFNSATKESGDYSAILNVGGQNVTLTASLPTVPSPNYEFSVNGILINSALDLGELAGVNLKLLSIKVKNNSPKTGGLSTLSLDNSRFKLLINQCNNKKLKPAQSCLAKVVVQGDNTNSSLNTLISFDNQSTSLLMQQSVQNLTSYMAAINSSISLGDFFDEGTNKIQLLKIENQGDGPGSIDTSSLVLPPGYSLGNNSCSNIKPGNTCVIRLVYSSSDLDKGVYTNTVTIGDSDVDLTVNQVSKPNSLTTVEVLMNENFKVNDCQSVQVNLKDDQGLPFVSSGVISVSSSLNLYQNSDCTNPATLSLTAFESSHQWFIKLAEAGANVLAMSAQNIQSSKYFYAYDNLQLNAANNHIVIGTAVNLLTSGGKPDFTYSIVSGGGSISGNVYTGDSVGVKVIKITDSLGNTAQTELEIHSVLNTVENSFEQITDQNYMVAVQGGMPPYIYSTTGVGFVDAVGLFFSPIAGNVDVKVKDALNQEVHILGVVYNPLQAYAVNNSIVIGQSTLLTATGGKTPYLYSVVSGGGIFTGGNYTPDSIGVKVLKVTDALGQNSQVSIEVFSVLTVGGNNFEKVVGQTYQTVVSGGKNPYTYSIAAGVGEVDNSGLYSASGAGTVDVKIKDALNQEVHVLGTIYSLLDISPKNPTITISNNQTFSGVGGKAPYTFQLLSGVGSISPSGVYSSNQAGNAQIKIIDVLGQLVQTGITVNSNLSISAGGCSFNIPESMPCTVSTTGGVGAKTFSTNQGTIDANTGLFKGQCVNNSGSSIVTVTDQYSNSAQVTLTYPCVYQSCNQIRAEGYGLTNADYWIDIDGLNTGSDPFKIYCDVTNSAGGGLALISSGGSNCGAANFTAKSAVSLAGSCGYLPETLVRTLAQNAQQVTLRAGASHSSYQEAKSSGNVTLNALRTGGNWNPGGTSGNFTEFTNTIGSWSWAYSCANAYVSAWPNMYQSCNNGAGVHWISSTSGFVGQSNTSGASLTSSTWLLTKYFKDPISCLDAKTRGIKNQAGTTLSGTYTIDPDGYAYGEAPYSVYCDQETDGGGWTLVVAGRGSLATGNTGTNLYSSSGSNYNACLLSGDITTCPINKLWWQPKTLVGTSYLKKFANYQLVVTFKTSMAWNNMIPLLRDNGNFNNSYYPSNPSVKFAGYSLDSSSAPGCQDAALQSFYYFAIGDANAPCAGNYSLLYTDASGGGQLGFLSPSGDNSPGQVFVR